MLSFDVAQYIGTQITADNLKQAIAAALQWANRVRNESPAPTAGSDVAIAMDADIKAIFALYAGVDQAAGITGEVVILAAIKSKLQELVTDIQVQDQKWSLASGRNLTVEPPCDVWHPYQCAKKVGGTIGAWLLIGVVGYYGGKYIYNNAGRWLSTRTARTKRSRRR